MAVCGLVMFVEGVSRGALRHRVFAAVVGIGFLIPLCLPWLFRHRWNSIRPRLLLAAGSMLLILLVVEVCIRLIGPSSFQHPEMVDHPILGHCLLPDRGGLDALGFRNKLQRLAEAETAATTRVKGIVKRLQIPLIDPENEILAALRADQLRECRMRPRFRGREVE